MVALSRIREDVVFEHIASLAGLWCDRCSVVRSRTHDLVDLIRLDAKLRSHLDGLEAAGTVGWELALEAALWREPGNAFVLLAVAGLRGDRDQLESTVARFVYEDRLWPALVSALAWLPSPLVAPMIDDWLEYDGPRWRALGLASSVARRRDPRGAVGRGLLDHSLDVVRHAVRACEVFGCRTMIPTLRALVDRAGLELVVTRALTVLGDLDGPARLWAFARRGLEHAEDAAELAMRYVSVATASPWLHHAAGDPALRRVVLVGAAATGSPACVRWLLDAVHDPEVAALAGFGLYAMLGLDLDASGLALEPESSNDLELPYPDGEGVEQWWQQHAKRFDHGRRYLLGRPLDTGVLREALLRAPQRLRWLAAHDLHRLRIRHSVPFEVDAPGWRQQRWLGGLAAGPSIA
ncbi:MAG: hypothetical protein AB1Z98_00235 [Nannocystaceae bacterium]